MACPISIMVRNTNQRRLRDLAQMVCSSPPRPRPETAMLPNQLEYSQEILSIVHSIIQTARLVITHVENLIILDHQGTRSASGPRGGGDGGWLGHL